MKNTPETDTGDQVRANIDAVERGIPKIQE